MWTYRADVRREEWKTSLTLARIELKTDPEYGRYCVLLPIGPYAAERFKKPYLSTGLPLVTYTMRCLIGEGQ